MYKNKILVLSLLFSALIIINFELYAVEIKSRLYNCQAILDDPDLSWTHKEKIIWNNLCKGSEVDLKVEITSKGKLKWNDDQIIKGDFIESILLDEPYKNLIHHNGVVINGAWIKEDLNLTDGFIATTFVCKNCRYDSNIFLHNTKINGSLVLINSIITKDLQLKNSIIFSDLFLYRTAVNNIDLRMAQINGDLVIKDTQIVNQLLADGINISGTLFIVDNSRINKVHLLHSNVNKQVEISDIIVDNILAADGINIGGSLILHKLSTPKLQLPWAKINGNVYFHNSSIESKIIGEGMKIEGGMFFRDNEFGDVSLSRIQVRTILEAHRNEFTSLNLSMSHIAELVLAKNKNSIKWKDGGILN